MTPKQFAKEMAEIAQLGDPEQSHSAADDLLCRVLEEKGFGEGVKTYLEMEKWYA